MSINIKQLARSIILAGFTAFFITLHYTGEISKYVNPTYHVLSLIALGIFAFLFIVQLVRVWEERSSAVHACSADCHYDHQHESSSAIKRFIGYAIIIFPLVTGFMLSPTTLDASIAAKKGGILPRAGQSENSNEESSTQEMVESRLPETNADSPTDSDNMQLNHSEPLPNHNYFTKSEYFKANENLFQMDTIQMDDKVYASYYSQINENIHSFIGKKMIVDGFVYREDGINANQLVLSRFYMVHCVADASITGFLSEFDEASTFSEDTWLELEGTLDVTTYNGVEIPILKVEKWTVSEAPDDPYVYPAIINVMDD